MCSSEHAVTNDVETILAELYQAIEDTTYTMLVAQGGLSLWRERNLALLQPKPEYPDPGMLIGFGPPSDPSSFYVGRWTRSQIAQNLTYDGPTHRLLSQQWVVVICAQWEEEFRRRLAKALGVDKGKIQSQIFADLTRIRNDIVHHRGIATPGNSGRARMLRWFKDRDPIYISTAQLRHFYESYKQSITVDLSAMTPENRQAVTALRRA